MFGISRQAVYQKEKRWANRQVTLAPVKEMVLNIRRYMPRIGTRKLYYLLRSTLNAKGIKLGRDGLFNYLRAQRMLVVPKRSYTRTTDSRHWMKKHPNRLKEMNVERPEQVFVSDITYVKSDEGVHYLSLVTDACSRKIMGYELSREMKATDVVIALKQAISHRSYQSDLLHHSDRGSQYCSDVYQSTLRQHNIKPSMTDGYDCYQNALAERINGILKQEFLFYKCKSIEQLRQLVKESVSIYNNYRPHLSLGMQTPQQVHQKSQL